MSEYKNTRVKKSITKSGEEKPVQLHIFIKCLLIPTCRPIINNEFRDTRGNNLGHTPTLHLRAWKCIRIYRPIHSLYLDMDNMHIYTHMYTNIYTFICYYMHKYIHTVICHTIICSSHTCIHRYIQSSTYIHKFKYTCIPLYTHINGPIMCAFNDKCIHTFRHTYIHMHYIHVLCIYIYT